MTTIRDGIFAEANRRWPVAPKRPDHAAGLTERALGAALLAEAESGLVRESTMRAALTKAAAQFREYQSLHTAKGTTDGIRKAHANMEMAIMCEGALK